MSVSEAHNNTLANLEQCKNYRFRTRGINDCSESNDTFSDEVMLFLVSVPRQMEPVEVVTNNGFLEFSWVRPNSCELDI